MKLLIIKNDDNYIRFKDKKYVVCKLDKASVYPFDKLDIVENHIVNLKKAGFYNALIYELVITENPFKKR